MVALSARPRPFPHGVTSAGEEIVILTWRDLEFFSQLHVEGDRYRTYCPIHGSDHQRSLSINAKNGFGHCFSCEARVFVSEFNPQMATRLQRRRYGDVSPTQIRSLPSVLSHPKKVLQQDWQTEEVQLLHALQAQGALRLDREAAWNGQAYLEARHIPLQLAIAAGVGYLGAGAGQKERLLQRWEDRLIFPLATFGAPLTRGFAGRLLWQWQGCQDETAHKQHLERNERKRWIKTNPAGWFWEPKHLPTSDPVIVVEGPFDRLAVLAAGDFQPGEVIALVGTALQPEWLSNAHAVLLALDGDQGGKEASKRIQQHLAWKQVRVEPCVMSSVGGKDWSERWSRQGSNGLEELYAQHALLAHGL